MGKIVFGTSLFVALVAAGCANSQLHQSLLLQENRQLEDALFVAHAQVADLQRENDWLRNRQENESGRPPRRATGTFDEEFDNVQPFEMPTIILPGQIGTEEVPESLRGSQTMPIWQPVR